MVELASLQHTRNLTDEVAEVLREYILSGKIRSGERVVQAEIARQLQISRGPVREALKQLVAEGLVRDEPRRGTFVSAPTANDIREVYDLRVGIEVRASQLLIARGRAAVKPLRDVMDRMRRAAADDDAQVVVECDFEFHRSLCDLSGNKRLHAVFVGHAAALRSLLRLDELHYESLDDLVTEHEALLEQLELGDEQAVATMLREHIEEAGDRLVARVQGDTASA